MIPDRAPSQEFVATGSATQFNCEFSAPEPANIHVAINGVEQTTGFTTSATSEGDGYVTFGTAPLAGSTVTVWRETPMKQDRSFGIGSAFYPGQVESALDDLTMMVQEVRGGTVAGTGVPYANEAGHAATADIATALVDGGTASYAANAGNAGYASNAGNAGYATNAGYASNAGSASSAGVASALVEGATAGYAANAGNAATAGVASALVEGATAGYAAVAGELVEGATVGYAESAGYANSAGAFRYDGPFAVENDTAEDNVIVSGGAVVVGNSRYEVPGTGATVPVGYDLYLSGSSYESSGGIAASFGYVYSSGTVESSDPNTFLTRIAHNAGGGMFQQFQFGDIVTVPWGIESGTSVVNTYKGPFWVSAATSNGTTLGVTVRPGVVVVGSKRYDTPWLPYDLITSQLSGTITLSSGYDLYLKGTSRNGGTLWGYVTTNGPVGDQQDGVFMTRLAYNSGGMVQQIQHGEITTVPWGIQGGTTSTTISGVMWPDLARKNSVSAGSAGVAPDGGWILGHMTCNAGNLGNQAYVTIYNGSTVAAATGSRMIELIGGMVASGATSETVSIDAAISIPIPAGGRFEFSENADSNTINWEYLKVHPIVGGEAIEIETNQ